MATIREIIAGYPGGNWKLAPGGELKPSTRRATQADVFAATQVPGADPTAPPFAVGDLIPEAGVYQMLITDGAGNFVTVKVSKPTNIPEGPLAPDLMPQMMDLDVSVVDPGEPLPASATTTPVEEDRIKSLTEASRAQADQARKETERVQSLIDQINREEAEREANLKAGRGRITDREVQTLAAQAAQTGVSQGQLDLARQQFEQNGQQAAIQSQIAQEQLKIAQANQALADRRFGLETEIAKGNMDATAAATALGQDRLAFDKQIEGARLRLQELQAQQTNQIAQGQLAVAQGGLQQRADEARQTAETTARGQALQAATTTYATERQAQQEAARTGQGLLQARAGTVQNLINQPFEAAGALSRGSAGKFGMLSGGGVNIPPGVLGGLVSGAQGLGTALYGGQSTLDAAVQAVEAIRPGASLTPMGQAAVALQSQLIEKARAAAGVGNVPAPTTSGPASPAAPPVVPQVTPPAVPPIGAAMGRAAAGVGAGALQAPVTQQQRGPLPHERSINFNPFSAPVTAQTPTYNIRIG